jgi:hypothetical protein
MMLKIYKQYKKAEDQNIKDAWLIEDHKQMEEIYGILYEKCLDSLFDA